MAEGLSTTLATDLLDVAAATYVWVQLHTGPPGPDGTASVATEADRAQTLWAVAASAALTSSDDTSWSNVAGNEEYTHFTVWSASSAGVFGFSGVVSANAVLVGDTFTIKAGDLDASFPVAT